MPLRVESVYLAPEREDIGKLRLEYYPKGEMGSDEENVLMGIFNKNTDSLLVHYKCFLLDAKGDECIQIENTNRLFPNDGKYHFFPRRTLLSLLDSLPTDELTFNWLVTVLGKGGQDGAPYPTPNTPSPTSTSHLDLALFTFHYVPFTWTIERFLAQLQRQYIDSADFSPSTDARYSFSLRLYTKEDTEKVLLALGFTSITSLEESTVNCRCSVVDGKGNKWNDRVGTHSISKPGQFGLYEIIPYRTLDNFPTLLLPEGKLTVKCELWIHEPRKELPPELRNPPPATKDSVPQLHISNSTFTSSIFASQSTITTGNINNTSSSTTNETTQLK